MITVWELQKICFLHKSARKLGCRINTILGPRAFFPLTPRKLLCGREPRTHTSRTSTFCFHFSVLPHKYSDCRAMSVTVVYWRWTAVTTSALAVRNAKVEVTACCAGEIGVGCWLLNKEKVVAQQGLKAKLGPLNWRKDSLSFNVVGRFLRPWLRSEQVGQKIPYLWVKIQFSWLPRLGLWIAAVSPILSVTGTCMLCRKD